MNDVKLLGVCAWLANRFEINVSGLRIAFIVFTILGVGAPILAYFILYLLKPKL